MLTASDCARASNTTPVIVIRFEADNLPALERIKRDFRAALQAPQAQCAPSLLAFSFSRAFPAWPPARRSSTAT
jgi:hypothetical protein